MRKIFTPHFRPKLTILDYIFTFLVSLCSGNTSVWTPSGIYDGISVSSKRANHRWTHLWTSLVLRIVHNTNCIFSRYSCLAVGRTREQFQSVWETTVYETRAIHRPHGVQRSRLHSTFQLRRTVRHDCINRPLSSIYRENKHDREQLTTKKNDTLGIHLQRYTGSVGSFVRPIIVTRGTIDRWSKLDQRLLCKFSRNTRARTLYGPRTIPSSSTMQILKTCVYKNTRRNPVTKRLCC